MIGTPQEASAPGGGRPRLRVLWVYHSAVVTAWRRTRVAALAEHGVDVTVVSAPRWNEGGSVVELDPGPGEDVVAARCFGEHPFLFSYDPRPLRRVLQRERFDVIDAHEEPASLALAEIMAVMRALRVDTPVVCYSAQNLHKTYPWPFRRFEKRALDRIRAVHSCNDDVEVVLRSKGLQGEVVNLGLGVDVEHYAPDGTVPVVPARSPFRVGYVGRIETRKGIFTLLTAMQRVDGATLTFVGAGPDEARLRTAIDVRDLGDRVRIQGFVDHEELPSLYRSLDVVVVPSIANRSWTEQFGRVVIEAMASGVPVIVSDAGSLPEVAAGAGLIVPEADPARLADAIIQIRDDPELRCDLRSRGLRRAQDFSWARIGADQAALYRRVASAKAECGPAESGVGLSAH